ncbi:hypothetical protein CP973_21475 [Streptomyces albofaciens JCM 4342]|nr:hypothetical protein CP973_21475 [Streptomyces albofaciens JCM 4342]
MSRSGNPTSTTPRALGRGVAQLIPQPGDISAAGRAAASLAALRTVGTVRPSPVGRRVHVAPQRRTNGRGPVRGRRSWLSRL